MIKKEGSFEEIILEVKAVSDFHPKHIAQAINYLKVSGNELALLVNFGDTNFILLS